METTVDRFLQYIRLERNQSQHTRDAYAGDLTLFCDYAARRGVGLEAVTVNVIRGWVLERSAAGDGASTLRRRVQALRAFYRWLVTTGAVADNPAAYVELARVPKRLPTYVREPQLNTLLDAPLDEDDAEAVRDRLIVMMLYETGMRRAELIGLRDAAVDTAKCELKVHGKRDKDRIIPFGGELRRLIECYRALRPSPLRGTFFVRGDGEPLYPSLVYKVVHDSLAEAGAHGKLSPHVLRHSFASSMLNGGARLGSVKELLGHESLAATQVYTHITLSELKNNYKLAHPRAQN